MTFPNHFVWGAGASSFQIEGGAQEAGRTPSVWDMFCSKPGATWQGHSGAVACEHYQRYRDDVALMRQIGLPAYRLSISWSRVLPDGVGKVNHIGLDFYDRLIDELLAAHIAPWVTLFHWDYPIELYARGGWLSPDSPHWFADYVQTIVEKLSDRVRHWITLNEPQCFIHLGLQTGLHAPGDKLTLPLVLRAAHHTLLAHGQAVQSIRAASKQTCEIGLAPVGLAKIPATETAQDIEAARQAMFQMRDRTTWQTAFWLDPIFLGQYPADALELFGDAMPPIRVGDLETIHQPLDFFGVNHYSSPFVRAGKDGAPEEIPFAPGHPIAANRSFVVPETLYWGPRFYWERYHLPIVITENGLPTLDWIALDGKVHDTQRIDFTRRYLLEYERAARDGAQLKGYFHWSVMDNFEVTEGYRDRFGLIHVDFPTQRRTLKDSAHWYRRVIETNGASLHENPFHVY